MNELLYDRICQRLLSSSFPQEVNVWLYGNNIPFYQSVVIKADNVKQYIEKQLDLDEAKFSIPPKPMPPFKYSFVEITLSSLEKRAMHVGCFKPETKEFTKILSLLHDETIEELNNEGLIENAGAILLLHSIKLFENNIYFQDFHQMVFLDKNYELECSVYIGGPTEDAKRAMISLSYLSLFSFSLMNCKNAIIINNNPPNRLQKKRIKRGELPLVQYKTISISGSVLTLSDKKAKNLKTEPIMPLHIVRGNFAVYDSNALFGKYHGTFWRPQHSRGDRDLGVIIKDYEIQGPQK